MKRTPKITLTVLIVMTLLASSFSFAIPIYTPFIPITPIGIPELITYTDEQVITTRPIYRLHNSLWNTYAYTTSTSQKADLISEGYVDNGIVAYVSPVRLPDLVPLYKFTSDIFGLTKLSTDYSLSESGWTIAGIYGYVPTEEFTDSALVHESYSTYSVGTITLTDDYYYGSDYIEIPLYGRIPSVPSGYVTVNAIPFVAWESSTYLQTIHINDISADVTGGDTYTIQWTSMRPSGYIDLMYSVNDGATWTTFEENLQLTATSGSYNWTVPNSPSSEAQLKILWSSNPTSPSVVQDTTNNFTILQEPGSIIWTPFIPPVELLTLFPAAPSSLSANPGMQTQYINLYWEDNTSTETGYVIERKTESTSFEVIATIAVDSVKHMDASIEADVAYSYRIKASGLLGDSDYSDTVTATFTIEEEVVIPDAPTAVTASFVDSIESEVIINWSAPSSVVTNYSVERYTGSTWVEINMTADETTLNFTDTDLAGLAGEVFYRVKAINTSMTSDASGNASVTFTDPGGDILDGSQSGCDSGGA
jgi:hypothetical protein